MIETATEIKLWPGVAPGSENWTQQETTFDPGDGEQRLRNVVVPTLTAFLPDPAVATGTAMVVAPGGGFFMLSMKSEGTDVAEWLQARGVAAFVLKYRLTNTGETAEDFGAFVTKLRESAAEPGRGQSIGERLRPALLNGAGADGIRALELVRERAAEWGIDRSRVGFMGFSAGGFLTTYVAAEAPEAVRPDFIAPIYGAHAPESVAADAPPLFTLVAADDALCLDGCLQTFGAWRAAGRPAELHVYAQGGHGFGMNQRGLPIDSWIERLADWMRSHSWI